MKKRMLRALAALLLVVTVAGSLSSCYLYDYLMYSQLGGGSGSTGGGDTVINVDGGDTNNITITPSGTQDLLAANKAILSAVSVYSQFSVYQSSTPETYAGSGVIYKLDKERGDAFVITNYHVIYNNYSRTRDGISEDITLYLYGLEGTKYAIPATFVGGSANYDIAILKVEGSEVLMKSPAVAATLADSDKVNILETAIAIGNPEGLGISATVGHINVDSETISIAAYVNGKYTSVSLRVMRTDTAVNGGNSGGGLFNAKGELIGIVNAKSADSEIENIGYAIPSNVARAIADNVLDYCEPNGEYYSSGNRSVYRCILGVTVSASELYVEYNTETGLIEKGEEVFISEVSATGIAQGKLYANDVINSITINGVKHKITRYFQVVDRMLDARVGDTVVFNVTRGDKTLNVEIEIGEAALTAW